jgi:(E)-4-hydroxy-3-methyl-but-2-enyl pyrophosphate reductase
MKFVFAKNLGFCTGVRRALETARDSLKNDKKPVWFLGEIIHNENVIEEMKKGGGKTILDPKEAKSGTLIIRAHGTPPLPKLADVKVRDATCLLVKRAQNVAKELKKNGYRVIIIGEKNHPEVKGILGNVGGQAIVVENEKQARKITQSKKIGVLAQTTQSQDNVDKILNVLRKKTRNLKWENTLCPQVAARQKELVKILKKADGVLVIGSKTSANTQQLAKIAKKNDKLVWQANSLWELKKISFKDIPLLGVVSGTSAPDWEVAEIKKFLITNEQSKS